MRYALLLLLVACKSRDPLTTGFTNKLEPPGGLRFGMSRAEAQKALPQLRDRAATISSSVALSVQFDDDRLSHAWVHVADPELARAMLEREFGKLWGPPTNGGWTSIDTGWRVTIECPSPSFCGGMQFLAYRPLAAAYFGTAVAPPKAIAPLRIGMTVDAARAARPDLSAPQTLTPTQAIAHCDGGADDVAANVYFENGKLAILAVDLPLFADAEKLLAAAWGPGAPDHTWKSADWRAELVPTRVSFDTPQEHTGGELRFTPAGN
jgi:hypothetical protein